MTTAIKDRDIRYVRAELAPVARCEDCSWAYPGQYAFMPDTRSTTVHRQAKDHTKQQPGHVVEVVKSEVTRYTVDPPNADTAEGN